MSLGLGKVQWSCHVCGRMRDDADISVHKVQKDGELNISANVRYCNDTDSCRDGAQAVGEGWLGIKSA